MTLNLSCIDLSVEDLLGCSFGLSKSEVSALLVLLESEEWLIVAALATKLKKDRSVVQRELSSLLIKGLIERDQRNKIGGGFEYLYRAKDKSTIKKTILEKSRIFHDLIRKQVNSW